MPLSPRLRFSPNAKFILAGSLDNKLRLWSLDLNPHCSMLTPHPTTRPTPHAPPFTLCTQVGRFCTRTPVPRPQPLEFTVHPTRHPPASYPCFLGPQELYDREVSQDLHGTYEPEVLHFRGIRRARGLALGSVRFRGQECLYLGCESFNAPTPRP